MNHRKQRKKIVRAVEGILDDEIHQKKLKKSKTLKSFIKKMKTRRKEIEQELKHGGLRKAREQVLREHLVTLDKQIKKAQKMLREQ